MERTDDPRTLGEGRTCEPEGEQGRPSPNVRRAAPGAQQTPVHVAWAASSWCRRVKNARNSPSIRAFNSRGSCRPRRVSTRSRPASPGGSAFRRPLQIDLGTVARGFAVDKAVEFLRAEGVEHARVEAGGDLHWLGTPADGAPLLHLRDPRASGDQFLAVPMRGPAVATTAAYLTNRRPRLLHVNHLVHPRTGRPLRSNVSVSVFAPSCTAADALARVVLFGDQQRWQPLLRQHGAAAAVVTARGEVVHFPA